MNMTMEQAVTYGKRIGCRYYVRNSNGNLLGGFRSRTDAEACRARWEREYRTSPFGDPGYDVFVEEA